MWKIILIEFCAKKKKTNIKGLIYFNENKIINNYIDKHILLKVLSN